jgi:integrase
MSTSNEGGPPKEQLKSERRRGPVARSPHNLTREQLKARLTELKAAAAVDKSEHTLCSYDSGIKHFLESGGVLPASETGVIAYVEDCQKSQLKPGTISHRIHAIADWHTSRNLPTPTDSEAIRLILADLKIADDLTPKKTARALRYTELERVVVELSRNRTLPNLRDSALLQVGFFGALSRSQITGITVADISWHEGGLLISIPVRLDLPSGGRVTRAIPYGTSKVCASTALKAWLQASGIRSGPVFRPFTRNGGLRNEMLGDRSVALILVARLREAGIAHAESYSGHSLIRGFVISAHLAGASPDSIMRQAGWKRGKTVYRYINAANTLPMAAVPRKSLKRQSEDF